MYYWEGHQAFRQLVLVLSRAHGQGRLPFGGPRVVDMTSPPAGPVLYGSGDNGYTTSALAAVATHGVIRRIESCA